jgi:hypothetical protein
VEWKRKRQWVKAQMAERELRRLKKSSKARAAAAAAAAVVVTAAATAVVADGEMGDCAACAGRRRPHTCAEEGSAGEGASTKSKSKSKFKSKSKSKSKSKATEALKASAKHAAAGSRSKLKVGAKPGARCGVEGEGEHAQGTNSEGEGDGWGPEEMVSLYGAVKQTLAAAGGVASASMWSRVAELVTSRSAEECCQMYVGESKRKDASSKQKQLQEALRRRAGGAGADDTRKSPTKAELAALATKTPPMITGGKGTLKRKNEIKAVLAHRNLGHEDDLFDSSPFKTATPGSAVAANRRRRAGGSRGRRKRGTPPQLTMGGGAAGRMMLMTPEGGGGTDTGATSASSPDTPGLLAEAINAKDVDLYVGRALKSRRQGRALRPAAQSHKPMREREVDEALGGKAMHVFEEQPESGADEDEEEDYYFSDEED